MRRRAIAIALACAVAGALQVLHSIAYGPVDPSGVVYGIATTAIELAALTAVHDRRRSVVAIAALAPVLGVALAFGFALAGGMGELPARVVAQIGLYNGVVSVGLWALAVAMPEARARTVELERLRTAAELATLRAHLQPHFLLNTLNTIAALAAEEPGEARELIAALGDLLRDALDARGETHALAAEIAWLRRYARIVEIRHRVRFRWDIAEATERVHIPRMLLQPLVENAVQHGALRCRDAGEVSVTATLDGARTLRCVVEDNGPGPATSQPRAGALGLELVTRRLELGGHGTFRLERADDRTRSIVEIAELAP
nr:histidine kinase [Kofleriaceae bacterium]